LGGVPLTELPLSNRRKRLEDFLPGLHPCLQLVAQTRGRALAQQWLALLPALEGVGQRNRMVTTHRGAETG